jgi:hypothetical protein
VLQTEPDLVRSPTEHEELALLVSFDEHRCVLALTKQCLSASYTLACGFVGQQPVSGSLKCFWDAFRLPGASSSVSLLSITPWLDECDALEKLHQLILVACVKSIVSCGMLLMTWGTLDVKAPNPDPGVYCHWQAVVIETL